MRYPFLILVIPMLMFGCAINKPSTARNQHTTQLVDVPAIHIQFESPQVIFSKTAETDEAIAAAKKHFMPESAVVDAVIFSNTPSETWCKRTAANEYANPFLKS